MITAEPKPIDELVDRLRGRKNILIVGCSTCVAECSAGGEREVMTLAPLLAMAMKVDGNPAEIRTYTFEKQCEWEFLEEIAQMIPETDAVLSLACGVGTQALAERFREVPVYPGVNTTALSVREEPGLWVSRCSACGDCILDKTQGICPVARCSKSLLNGPCGGTRKEGKCEVDENIDCVWYLISERAKDRGALEELKRINKVKDWSNSAQTGPKRISREDLRT
jgi:ferredoxin